MVDAELISFIARAKRRREVLKLLESGEKSQLEIINKTKMYKSHVSRALKEICEKELIECKNPENREFKFYKINTKGKKILRDVENIENNYSQKFN